MACLLYCVTRPNPEVKVATGVGDAAVQSTEMEHVRVYWSEVENVAGLLGEPEALKKAALQFHQVLRSILTNITPIPFRFPTLLESAEVMEEHLAPEREMYRATLE